MVNLQIDDDRLNLAYKVAQKAGDKTKLLKKKADKERKHNGSIVTEADREAERIVREMLQDTSSYPILGEEQGGDVDNSDTYWVVDPIDGTKNYSYHQPLYGTAVALVEDNKPSVGVFYMPELNYVFYAVKDEGAYRGEHQLHVSEKTDVSDAYIMFSGRNRTNIQPGVSEELNNWNQQLGCAVMGEGWVSSGWVDVGIYGALAPWDMAVGNILINESGGVMKTVTKGSTEWDDVSDGRVVFGNDELVDSVINNLPEESIDAIESAEYDY